MIIDSDAHVVEARDLFEDRLPRKYDEWIPRVRYRADLKQDWWFVGDTPIQSAVGSVAVADADEERTSDYRIPKRYDDQHPSSWDPTERVKVMDRHEIRMATTYPWLGLTGPDVYRAIPGVDDRFQMLVVSAYNDWIRSWAEAQPGRFITVANIPYWNIDRAVEEIQRCASIGMNGLVMSGKPQNHGCPYLADPHWDPLWAAASDARMSISFHAAGGGDLLESANPRRRELLGWSALTVAVVGVEFFQNAIAAIDLLMSGVLQRFPNLNFAIVESGCGWVPFVLETLDEHYFRYKPWEENPSFSSDEPPSEVFRRQMFVNTWYERVQPHYPIDNIMFETDFPHPTALFGDEVEQAIKTGLASLSNEDREKILWKNAARCFNLSAHGLI